MKRGNGSEAPRRVKHRVVLPVSVKLGLGVALVVALSSTVLFYELMSRERERLVGAKVRASLMVDELLAASLAAPLDFEDQEAAKTEVEHAKVNEDVLWAGVYASGTGKLIAQAGDTSAEGISGSPEEGAILRESSATVTKRIVGRDGQDLGRAVIVMTLEPENRQFSESRGQMLRLCLLLGLGTATLLVLMMHLSVIRPLKRLADGARRLEEGEENVRVEIATRDEVGALASAFNAMTAAVSDRETKLAEARRAAHELLDNMRQAIVAFGRDGRVAGVQSRAAAEVFGRSDLEGKKVADLLFSDVERWNVEREAFETWLELASDVEPDQWQAIADLAPREVALKDRLIELDFRPLESPDRRFMLLATDITDRRKLEQTRDRQKREMVGMKRMLGGAHLFWSFLDSARDRVARCSVLAAVEGKDDGATVEIKRHVHTLKGEAHVYELLDVIGAARETEDRLACNDREATRAALVRLAQSIDDASSKFLELAGPEAVARVPVDRATLDRLTRLTNGRGDEIEALAKRLSSRPFGELVAPIAERVTEWAHDAGKKVHVTISGEKELVPRDLGKVLAGAIVHLVKNAIAHGIEPPADRTAQSKSEAGTLALACTSSADAELTITVEDDGAGIDAEAVLHLFDAGYTTKTSTDDLAGRGVGLFAARRELQQVRYDVKVAQGRGEGTKFEIRPVAAT